MNHQGNMMGPVKDPNKREHVLALIRRAFNAPSAKHVPVDNPVSLDRQNIGLLREREYIVAFKADGTRYLLALTMYRGRRLAAFVDRAGRVFSLQVRASVAHFKYGSVYDGELCQCNTGSNSYDYLVFNALMSKGAMLYAETYPQRLAHVRDNFSPSPVRMDERQRIDTYVSPCDSRLNFVCKEWDLARNMRAMDHNITPRYSVDGYVFTPCDEAVVPGRSESVLKWKSDNPIDPLFVVLTDGTVALYVDDDGTLIRLDAVVNMRVRFDVAGTALQSILEGAGVDHRLFRSEEDEVFRHVIETDCAFTEDQGVEYLLLRYIRMRPDKDGPNNAGTILRTLRTIRDNIQQQEIYEQVLPNTV